MKTAIYCLSFLFLLTLTSGAYGNDTTSVNSRPDVSSSNISPKVNLYFSLGYYF